MRSTTHPPGRVRASRPQPVKAAFSFLLSVALATGAAGPVPGAGESSAARFADLSIEELMKESVTSVSKHETLLAESPAAISVVTHDEIRRLGITSIPEALRMVPGLDVARINASQWAISSRGFNNQYANKLLVLMDGRSLYTPAFGGVFWDVQDMVLDDLDRIEVIRGPGATLWGANAVNGVINIISKNSKDTQGALISSAYGSEDQPSHSIRYGGKAATNLHYRVYVKYFDREGLVDSEGNSTPDDWDSIRGGFRMDWEASTENLLTLQGDYYTLNSGESVRVPTAAPPYSQEMRVENLSRGMNALGRWTRTFSDESQLSLQAYLDHFRHEAALTIETRDTADIELQHRFPLGGWNDLIWGVGYRFTTDEFNATPIVVWDPPTRELHLWTVFLQDEITIVPDRIRLTLGSKFEHNDYTGLEIQPSALLSWSPTDGQTVWAAASRSVSTPGRVVTEARINTPAFQPPFGPLILPALIGDPNLRSETLNAYELGYRIQPAPRISIDVATFYNVYDELHMLMAGPPRPELEPPPPHLLLPLNWENSGEGETTGAEVSVQWKPLDAWRLKAGYTWLQLHLSPDNPISRTSPQHQASLQSYLSLPWDLECNSAAYFVDEIEALFGSGSVHIPAYVRLDVGLTWRPSASFEAGIWGYNLLDNHHAESTGLNTSLITEIPRGVLGKITLRF